MPDDFHERDILIWSEHQADLLRRVAAGERVNNVDWPHVIEEIEDVGAAILNSVRGLLRQAIVHLLKIHLFPADPARDHWLIEIDTFLADAEMRLAPSMRQRIDLDALWRRARALMLRYAGTKSAALPTGCPWPLDDLLAADSDALLAGLAKPSGTP